MEFMECVKGRRTIRKYRPDKIDPEVIKRIIEAASNAPSWRNSQTARYIAVQSEEMKVRLEAGFPGIEKNINNIRSAPAVIIVTTVKGGSGYNSDGTYCTSKGSHWESFDAGIAVQTLCLAAHNEGLGTVIIGMFVEEKLLEAIDIPEGQSISALVAIGFADEAPNMPKRKSADELLSFI